VVADKISGKVLAIVNNIFNKDYFSKHFGVMNDLNSMIIEQVNKRELKRGEDMFERFKFSQENIFMSAFEWLN
jgi:hypothetical protein